MPSPPRSPYTRLVPRVNNLSVRGTLRLALAPLVPALPGFGALTVSMARTPQVRAPRRKPFSKHSPCARPLPARPPPSMRARRQTRTLHLHPPSPPHPKVKFGLDFGPALGGRYTARPVGAFLDPFIRDTLANAIVWPQR